MVREGGIYQLNNGDTIEVLAVGLYEGKECFVTQITQDLIIKPLSWWNVVFPGARLISVPSDVLPKMRGKGLWWHHMTEVSKVDDKVVMSVIRYNTTCQTYQ